MGAINYHTSDYITIGYDLSINHDDFEDYDDFINYIDYDYEDIKYLLEQEDFYYFHITIKAGYYEGFSIDIENNFPLCFENYAEKLEAQKEITRIKKFLINCLNYGCCSVYPGWCTGYANRQQSLKDINNAIKKMRLDITQTPTFKKWCEA